MPNPVVHFEIGCRNSEQAQVFFSKLFDWQIEPAGPAAMIAAGSADGIAGHITSLGHEPHNYVTVYVQVDNVQTYLEKAEGLGGKTMIPPTDVAGMGQFGWFSDLDGNIVGLWKPLEENQ